MRVAVGQRALDLARAGAWAQPVSAANVLEHRRAIGIHRHPIRLSRPARPSPHGPRALSFSAVGPKFAPPASPARSSLRSSLPAAADARRCAAGSHAALAGFDGRGTAALAVDLETGERRLRAQRRARPLLPASNEKLAVTYAALVALGPSFRMRTEVLGDGRLRDGVVWVGDLVLKGYGDPTFSTTPASPTLARDVRASGIRRVTGRLRRPTSRTSTRGAAAPGWKPWFVTGESRPLSALGPDGARRDREARSAGRSGGPASASPAATRSSVRAGGWPLAVRFSPPLEEILHRMDVESDNFTWRRCVLKQLGAVARAAGHDRGGRRGRPRDPRRAEDPARRRPDRRRLRPVRRSTA